MKRKIATTIFIATIIFIIGALIIHSLIAPPPDALALAPPAQGLKRVADFYFDVATGDVRSHSSINKFGNNEDIDSAAVEDIWDGGGLWNEPTATQVYTVVSTSATDTGAGTGARTLEINGLGSTGLQQSETITLAGATAVTLTNQYQMIHRMIVRSAGSGGANAGTITANANTDANITAQITITNNQTLMAIYKIPSDSDGCVTNVYGSILRSGGPTTAVDIILYAKPTGEVWQVKHVSGLTTGATSQVNHKYGIPKCFEPLTLLKVSAGSTADNIDGAAGFDLVLHPN